MYISLLDIHIEVGLLYLDMDSGACMHAPGGMESL